MVGKEVVGACHLIVGLTEMQRVVWTRDMRRLTFGFAFVASGSRLLLRPVVYPAIAPQ